VEALVAELARRGKLLVGEPFFEPHVELRPYLVQMKTIEREEHD